jgi:spore germination protein YaaH
MTTLLGAPDLIREVNFFWYELGSNGQIVGSLQTPGALEKLRAAGTRIVPSIMNDFSAERVHTMVSDPQKRSAHIQDLLALVVENGYDGIDIDYESMYAEDRENFTLFIEELAQVFHANGKLLSIAVHAKVDDEGAWAGAKAQDWARLGAAVDMFKIMTYDYHNAASEAGPIAPISWVDQVLAYAATVVPAEKTYLGLPVYGYEWFLSQAKSLRWDGAQAIVNRTGAQIQRDESNEAWFQYDSGGQHTVYFIDALSTETKLRAILGRYPHLAGVAIWVLGGEDPQTWEAIRRVYAEIEE